MIACSSTLPTSPSATAIAAAGDTPGVQYSIADDPPSGNPAISCPSDAPQDFRVGTVDQRADVSWRRIHNITYWELVIEEYNSTNVWVFAYRDVTDRVVNSWHGGRPGGRYRARVRSYRCNGRGNWTAFRQFSLTGPPDPPPDEKEPPDPEEPPDSDVPY